MPWSRAPGRAPLGWRRRLPFPPPAEGLRTLSRRPGWAWQRRSPPGAGRLCPVRDGWHRLQLAVLSL
eukprot:11158244-Alexandrium_andersonii.AAC.1